MASNNPAIKDLKQYIQKSWKEELITEISYNYNKMDSVEDYYQLEFFTKAETQVNAKYERFQSLK